MPLDIDTMGAGPIREVQTSQGPVLLYMASKANLRDAGDLRGLDPGARGREMLRCLTSQTRRSRNSEGPPKPIPAELLDALTDADLQAIGDALREVLDRYRGGNESGAALGPIDKRRPDETPFEYFARLVDGEELRDREQMRAIADKALKGLGMGVGDSFSALRKQSGLLDDKATQLERLTVKTGEMNRAFIDREREAARQRAEDRERVRMTAETTAASARSLQQLVSTAETFMTSLAQREQDERGKYRTQLKVAVVSLVVSAVLAAGSLWYAKQSYDHDLVKDATDDAAAKAAAGRDERLTAAIEQNAALVQRNTQLVEQLQSLAARQAASAASSGQRRSPAAAGKYGN